MRLRVPVAVLRVICFALELYSSITPNRWVKIRDYVRARVQEDESIVGTPTCEIGEGRQAASLFDVSSAAHLKCVSDSIYDKKHLYLNELPCDILLMPTGVSCCGKELKFNKDSWSGVTIYTTLGAVYAKAYHLTCCKCTTQYWHSYSEKEGKDKLNYRTFDYPLTEKYFMTTRSTAFETRYLLEVVVDCELSRSFEEITERFNRLYATEESRGQLYKTRLEDAFFIFKLLTFFHKTVTVHIDKISNRVNIDKLCDQAMEEVFTSEAVWMKHKCTVAGCMEGFVVCDGNEKLSRRICSAPRHSFKLSHNMPKIVSRCGNSPVFGGANQKASRYCKDHIHLDSPEPSNKKILLTINIPDQMVSTKLVDMSCSLPSNEDTTVHVACKKVANVKHFHDRTAGVMAIVRPCGIVVDWREMYTCESASQLFIQLLKLMDEDGANINFVGYDRACEFVPFLRNLKARGNPGAEKLLESASYVVDNFHIAGHTTDVCNPNHPACEFHHSLPKFAAIAGANTECAEQCFSWLKKFKNIVKYMTSPRFRFYMHVVINAHNRNIEKKAARN